MSNDLAVLSNESETSIFVDIASIILRFHEATHTGFELTYCSMPPSISMVVHDDLHRSIHVTIASEL